MKRSEMIKKLQNLIFMSSALDMYWTKESTEYILKGLEEAGMLPPTISVELVEQHEGFGGTSTDNINEWESEDNEASETRR